VIVEVVDPGERRGDDLARRDLAPSDEGGEVRNRLEHEIGRAHAAAAAYGNSTGRGTFSPACNSLKAYHAVMHRDLPEGPPVFGVPYWYWLGGRPALDFVNTRRERWRGNVECLRSPKDLTRWLRQAGVLAAPASAGRARLAAALELREAIDAGVRAAVAAEPPAPGAIAVIDGWLDAASARPALVAGPDGRPRLDVRPADDPLAAALGALALDAAQMLGRPQERERIRICGSETCAARFYDRSPAAQRRWCSMALCGNVAKARRHRARAAGPGARRAAIATAGRSSPSGSARRARCRRSSRGCRRWVRCCATSWSSRWRRSAWS
jgi:predicted RNA-binding Zn ribbon-like protein